MERAVNSARFRFESKHEGPYPMKATNPEAPNRRPTKEQKIDESIDESFPASDPPSHSGVTTGAPKKRETPDEAEKD